MIVDNQQMSTDPAGRACATPEQPRNGGAKLAWAVTAAAAAGLAAVANHQLAKRAEARHPPRGRFMTVDGVRLHYLDQGAGFPIVLVHGNGVTSEDFVASGLVSALAASHRVIVFDRPGFGYSDRPRNVVWTAEAQARLLLQALALIGAARPLVVGHSWGSLVAADIALQAPEAISGVVLMSGYYRPTVRLDAALLAGPAIPLLGDVLRFTLSPALARLMLPQLLKALFAPAPVSERFTTDYPISLSLRPSQLRAAAAEAALMTKEAARLSARLPGLATPTLVVAGQGDRIIDSWNQTAWLASQVAGSELLTLEGAGHMVHHTAGDEVAAAIRDFAAHCFAQQLPLDPLQLAEKEAGQTFGRTMP